jgi:hypothetical protein
MTSPRLPSIHRLGGCFALALLVGCGSDAASPKDAAIGADSPVILPSVDGGEAGIPAIGGSSLPPPSDAEMPPFTTDAPYTLVNGSCCPLVLSIADPDGSEAAATIVGDQAPLAAGVPMAWSNGRWSAQVCMPLDTLLLYRFYFGHTLASDTGDGGAPVDADDNSAGWGGEPVDTAPVLVDDYRWSSEVPARTDSTGATWNVFAPILSCAP